MKDIMRKNINKLIEDNKFRVNYKIKLDKDNFINLKELVTYHSAPVITITSSFINF